jgi:HK97 family phage portal protein
VGLIRQFIENRSTLANPAPWFHDAMSGPRSYTGRSVGADDAMRSMAVLACVKILAESVASLPLPVYKRLGAGGKERAPSHPLYPLLHDLPNPEITSMELREVLMAHLGLWGNAYCEVVRDELLRPVQLWPLSPNRVKPARGPDGALVYGVKRGNGSTVSLRADQVWRIKGFGTDSYSGLSPIGQAREAIGLALATEEFGARFFGNGRPSGVLKHKGQLSKDGQDRLKASWESAHNGLSNSHRVAILEEGMEWQQMGIPPEDAQFLETRKFQVAEIARLYRVPLHMVGDLDRSTNNNIEHQSIEFVVHTLRPWLVRIEHTVNRDLLTPFERKRYFAEFLIDGLLRGDSFTRAQALQIQRQNGVINADDWREIENMNPLPDGQGQTYIVPANMQKLDQIGQQMNASNDAQGNTKAKEGQAE